MIRNPTQLASRYLAFLWYAFNADTKRFRNFMNYQRHWLEGDAGSDDSHGRGIVGAWAPYWAVPTFRLFKTWQAGYFNNPY